MKKEKKETYDLGKIIIIQNDWDSGKLATDKGVEIHWHGRFIPESWKGYHLVLEATPGENEKSL